MATENDFNAYLSTHIRRMGTAYKALKIADKVKAGLSDFLIFYKGRAVAMECKHMKTFPTGKRRALKHPVSGPQLTFLKGMALAGVPGFVVIASAEERLITLIPADEVPLLGNWSRAELEEARRVHGVYSYMDIPKMVEWLFEAEKGLFLAG
jgi:penicillin-binding protein-related factor A (putative recombinase)